MKVWAAIYVVGYLVFGAMNTFTTKLQFGIQAVGVEPEAHNFRKPWFGVWTMFVGMATNLLIHWVQVWRDSRKRVVADSVLTKPLNQDNAPLSPAMTFLIVGVPSMFDLMATGLSYIGLLFMSASIWQMLRGANIIFSALMSVMFLGRKMKASNWAGIAVVVCGISLVGLSNLLTTRAKGTTETDVNQVSPQYALFGMAMLLVAQVFSGGQVVSEELLLKGRVAVAKSQLVGYEGIWGTVILAVFFMPVMQYLPGSDAGSYENSLDTYEMLKNSSELRWVVAAYTFSCMTYNLCAVGVTGELSAVHRTMFMALRTLVVWVVDLCIHEVDPHSPLGESWTVYSYLELFGFVVLVTGQMMYAEIIPVPFLARAPQDPELADFSSPANTKLMSPGMPGGRAKEAEDLDAKEEIKITDIDA